MRFLLTLWLCKIIAAAIRLVAPQRGTTFSGYVATRLMPDFLAHFRGVNPEKVIYITGTNGKSTTTNLLRHILESAGKTVACNLEGANMMGGAATTFLKNSTVTGRMKTEYVVLEVDERSLPGILKVLPCRHLGITNLQKDQAQRNGDPDFIVRKFRDCIGTDLTLYLSNEEPRSKALEQLGAPCVYYGLASNRRTCQSRGRRDLTMPCPVCGHPIAYKAYNLVAVGPFACTHCDYGSMDVPDVWVDQVDFEAGTFQCAGETYRVLYTEPCYLYNYAMILGLSRRLGLTTAEIQAGFETFVNPAARASVTRYHGKELHFMKCKQENPEASQSLLDMIAVDKRPKAVMIGLYEIEDFDPFFAGSFYLFDCDLGPVIDSGITEYVAFSRTVAWDIANRLVYAGVDRKQIQVLDTNEIPAILETVDRLEPEVVYMVLEIEHDKAIQAYLSKHGGTEDE